MYPQGTVERLPVVRDDGSTAIPGLYVAGDLAGVPLLKFSQESGTQVVRTIAQDPKLKASATPEGAVDVAILGAGVAGVSAAMECRKHNLSYVILEAEEPFATIADFPKKKPIYLYPTEMKPTGDLNVSAGVKEDLLKELCLQLERSDLQIQSGFRATHVERSGDLLVVRSDSDASIKARRVIVAIGRTGDFRHLNVPGEDLEKVFHQLYDPAAFAGQKVLVLGGGDSAAEAAIAIAEAGGEVTLSYRSRELTRPKPENVERAHALFSDTPLPGRIFPLFQTTVKHIHNDRVDLLHSESRETITIANDSTLVQIGREAPLDFFRHSGIPIQGEWRPMRIATFAAFLLFCVWLYNWKAGGFFGELWQARGWFPFNINTLLPDSFSDPSTLLGTLRISLGSPAFYYTFVYSVVVTVFGIQRIRRRRTPYVKWQTIALIAIQVLPLFLLPEIILPWLGHNGMFDHGILGGIADALFPVDGSAQGRQYWRTSGFILAWPLFLYNFFTDQPMVWWLVIGCIQTFVLIPGMIYFWGKGAYCGWICSCGALAETLGDTHRQKMPHGPFWSKLNMVGQVILWLAVALMLVRIAGWIWPHSVAGAIFDYAFSGKHYVNITDAQGYYLRTEIHHNVVNYKWIVDVTLSGVIGVGFYFWYSGRVWCRHFCPLAALMHIFAKFSRFRIIPEKKKCISCNVCTSVCHQGIDVMNFANRGIAMEDPECVRCSACVQMCPTGVLQFGQVDKDGNVIKLDKLAASPVLMRESSPPEQS